MHFTKLRVSGFKSFVDPAEVPIEPGMTGVVGPNGCGKSNVVEALRWVMGETSAKQMRGGEMDDVIFGGTASRPARNIAEVILHLDNSDRTAPAQFNDTEELEISRRIERGSGSTYRINGREVRARDVQLLFADLATGAHSTAMVSQGRVGALIGAKPTERRGLLEEAAGIKGLHSRRHEAELRLRAAETNLERLEEVIGALQGQYQGLQRQARQATRYRNISDQLRQLDAILLHQQWRAATNAREEAVELLKQADSEVAAHTGAASTAATRQGELAASLPDLREREAAAAAELQRLTLARRELDSEEGRVQESIDETERELDQIAADTEREAALDADAKEALSRLAAEKSAIEAERQDEEATRQEATEAFEQARGELTERENALTALTERVAMAEARRAALMRQQDEVQQRLVRLRGRSDEIGVEREKITVELQQHAALQIAEKDVQDAEAAVESARKDLDAADEARTAATQAEQAGRAAAQTAESAQAKLTAEISAIEAVLETGSVDLFPPLMDALEVQPGYEKALAAAIGEDLTAPIDTAAEVHWAHLSPLTAAPALPDGAAPLSQFVKAPPVMSRRLAATGVIEETSLSPDQRDSLAPGQRLVTKDGALWRWDGFTIRPGAPTAAAKRLQQRNRLAELREHLKSAATEVVAAQEHTETLKAAVARATESEWAARTALESSYGKLNTVREKLAESSSKIANSQSRAAALSDSAAEILTDVSEAEAALAAIESDLAAMEDTDTVRAEIEALRAAVTEWRSTVADRQSAYNQLHQQAAERDRRVAAIGQESQSWHDRAKGAEARIESLTERRTRAAERQTRLTERPEQIQEQRSRLLDAISTAETGRQSAADALAVAETALAEADKALRNANAVLAEARESRIRCEARVEQAEAECNNVASKIAEKLNCKPDEALKSASIESEDGLPEPNEVEDKIERLIRQRDSMGPVNLRAETELAELEEQINSMRTEREDLLAAIARLRRGISSLNREGRERLLAAFETVNSHFEELFERLFGGGKAYLTLTEADDPLEAGLEIMASPPGKKTQIMSLLSGGEQALTAIALLFAVFLTNPAPICVLDEVDAPLDDANVDRFCTLLDEIAHSGITRFLCVTHHRMTMARMDRLFGVTMGERGVSQLVSVDLRRAQELRDSA